MRLDLILKHSGLLKKRTVAKYYCDRGLVLINGKVSKPSSDVKSDDIITININNQEVKFTVRIERKENKITLTYDAVKNEENLDA